MAFRRAAHVGLNADMPAQRAVLAGGRWHLQQGPMDIIIGAEGDALAVNHAHHLAWERFKGVLSELVQELDLLRSPVPGTRLVQGPIAQRIWRACVPFQHRFIKPMAAVAGSVAQELLTFYTAAGIKRAWANNGGDIAIHLTSNQRVRVGLYADLANFNARQVQSGLALDGQFEIRSHSPVRGVATSGWRGRSFSFGIADSVMVLAPTASAADAAATVIANAVNIDDSRFTRRPARDVKDDSDLGGRLVTVNVPRLPPQLVQRALASGLACALSLRAQGHVSSVVLVCQDQRVVTDMVMPAIANDISTAICRGAECA